MEGKEFKRCLKRKVKITFGLLISFLICGTVVIARESTVQDLQQEVNKQKKDIENLKSMLNYGGFLSLEDKNYATKIDRPIFALSVGPSYAGAYFSTVVGTFSNVGGGDWALAGTMSSILGSYNRINLYNKEKFMFDGVANSIVGTVNETTNANGALIFGAGNKIENSYRPVQGIGNLMTDITLLNKLSDNKTIINKLSKLVGSSGGSVLAVGGANEANYAQLSKMIGVGNSIKGTDENNISRYNSIDGYNNNIENGSYNAIIGNNYTIKGNSNNILFGFNKDKKEVKNSNVASLGNDINISEDDAVYLGNGASSSADTNNSIWLSKGELDKDLKIKKQEYEKKRKEYDEKIENLDMKMLTEEANKNNGLTDDQLEELKKTINVEKGKITEEFIKYEKEYNKEYNKINEKFKEQYLKKYVEKGLGLYSKFAGFSEMGSILSVGNANFTRVIQNVAPGLISSSSTDAINGSQLYYYINKGIKVKDGSGRESIVKLGDTLTLTGTNVEVKHEKTEPITAKAENAPKPNNENTTKPEPSSNKTENKVEEPTKPKEHTFTFNVKKIDEINRKIEKIDKKADEALDKSNQALVGVSNAVAMANLVQVNSYSRHRHNLSAAYGYYGGSHALAIGFSGVNEKRNFVYKLSGSVNNHGNLALGLGIGVMLGKEDNEYPVNSKLQEEVKTLKEEVRMLKEALSKVK